MGMRKRWTWAAARVKARRGEGAEPGEGLAGNDAGGVVDVVGCLARVLFRREKGVE
jgi:hypothetical protein